MLPCSWHLGQGFSISGIKDGLVVMVVLRSVQGILVVSREIRWRIDLPLVHVHIEPFGRILHPQAILQHKAHWIRCRNPRLLGLVTQLRPRPQSLRRCIYVRDLAEAVSGQELAFAARL